MSLPKLELTIPDDKRVFFVGDIHGNYPIYQRALKQFGITEDDYVISVGDFIDRGNQSTKLIEEFCTKPNRYSVLGNHEFMLVNSKSNPYWYKIWKNNGGAEFIDEVGSANLDKFRDILKKLPVLIEVNHRGKRIAVSHAGMPVHDYDLLQLGFVPGSDLAYDLVWDHTAFDYAMNRSRTEVPAIVHNVDYTIHGHVAVNSQYLFGNRVYIDTQFLSGELCFAYLDENSELQYLQRKRDEFSFVQPK